MLLILAGASIATITGYDSIPDNAKTAVDASKQDATAEQNMVNAIDALFKKYSGLIPLKGVAKVDANGLAVQNTLIRPEGNTNLQIVIPEGWAPAILEGSNSTISLPGEDGKVKSIMPAGEWENITAEQINKGIVIVDNAITYTDTVPNFNEFVWVPITDSSKFARTAWITKYTYDGEGNWIDGTNTTIGHPLGTITDNTNNWWEDTTTTEYINMVSSVNKYKGFYIGRYEASVNGTIAQSKRGQTAKVSISQTDAISACTSNTSASNMHLMYGIEWDSTLNWLNNNATISSISAGTTKTMELSDLQTNSNTWGNYNNTTGDAASTPYVKNTVQNTGASEYWKANNIYDLAGNVWEWGREKYSTGSNQAVRGGGYNNGADSPAVSRYVDYTVPTHINRRFQGQLLFVALPYWYEKLGKVTCSRLEKIRAKRSSFIMNFFFSAQWGKM